MLGTICTLYRSIPPPCWFVIGMVAVASIFYICCIVTSFQNFRFCSSIYSSIICYIVTRFQNFRFCYFFFNQVNTHTHPTQVSILQLCSHPWMFLLIYLLIYKVFTFLLNYKTHEILIVILVFMMQLFVYL